MKVKLAEEEKVAKGSQPCQGQASQDLRGKLKESLGGRYDLKAINELTGELKSIRDAIR
jgi:hypothetical protein